MKDPIKFHLARVPEFRTVQDDPDATVIQLIEGENRLDIVADWYTAWATCRGLCALEDEFSERAIERIGSQGLRMDSLMAKIERLTGDLARLREEYKVQRTVREHLERDLCERDGLERTHARIAEIAGRAKKAAARQGGGE